MPVHFRFDNSYARLPERLYARLDPTPVAAPRLVRVNAGLAESLGLDPEELASPEGVEILAGNRIPEGAAPIALAYAGHQFGHFVPQLGDGRAILLGEIVGRDGARHDIQLKGSGRTPYSRDGDGRAALGPVLREYIVSEAMAALGVPTTRALAAVTTGERGAARNDAAWRDPDACGREPHPYRHVPVSSPRGAMPRRCGCWRTMSSPATIRRPRRREQPYRALLDAVVARQADLIARWMLIGFIHGVMNTDNTSIAGETIDYGPCAFMDAYDPATVFSSIDHAGRYAYGNQPSIAQWNLARFAETLLPLLAEDEDQAVAVAKESLGSFAPALPGRPISAGLQRKIGLATDREEDVALAQDLLTRMAENARRLHLDIPPAVRRGGGSGGRCGRARAVRGSNRL